MIATSLTKLALDTILEEINKVSKVKIERLNSEFIEYLNSRIDATQSDPLYHYEISGSDTITSKPHAIDLDGVDFFEWANDN